MTRRNCEWVRYAALFATAMWIAGCGTKGQIESASPQQLKVRPSLTISPAFLAPITAGGAPIQFHATLVGSSSPIAWTLTGLGALTYPQYPPAPPDTTYTPPTTVTSQTTATLVATAGPLQSNVVTITIDPAATVDVTGKVVDQNGFPMEDAALVFTGLTGNYSTTSEGTFQVDNVPTPYDLTVIDTTSNTAVTYKSLTSSGPLTIVMFLDGTSPATPNSGTVQGSFNGFNLPSPACVGTICTATEVVFASAPTNRATTVNFLDLNNISGAGFVDDCWLDNSFGVSNICNNAWSDANPSSFNVEWRAPKNPLAGTLYALEWQFDSTTGLPVIDGYQFFGVEDNIILANGSTATAALTGLTLDTVDLQGSTTVPLDAATDYAITAKTVYLNFGDKGYLPIVYDFNSASFADPSFSYFTPQIANTTLTVGVEASSSTEGESVVMQSGLRADAMNVAMTLFNAPALVSPINNPSTPVTNSTVFNWHPFANGVNIVSFFVCGFEFVVVTTDASTEIPDLSAKGMALPANCPSSWLVTGLAPFASTDEVASGGLGIPSGDTHYFGSSNVWNFSTGP